MTGNDRRERGSTLVEFAMVLPLLALMAFGILEFGLALQDRMTVQAATRTGIRVGSAAGGSVDADNSLLLSLGSAVGDVGIGNVDWVLVYKSAAADGAVPAACKNPPRAATSTCNLYTGAQLSQVLAGTAPSSWFGCGLTALDRYWCPTSRETIQANGTDYLGIWMQVRRPMVSGFFGSTLTMRSQGVMRLEPRAT